MNHCIFCGNKLFSIGKRGIEMYKCPICGLGVTQGSDVDYSDYHRDAVYINEEKQFKNIFLKRVSLISKFQQQGKVLEIGSSSGLMLSLLKELGWNVTGIEPSINAFNKSRERGIATLNQTFEQAMFKKESFNLVIMNHVLEHVDNPTEVLKKIKVLLKNNGMLLIDVPNFASFSAQIWGAGWKYVLPNEHKWHFSKKSLSLILGQLGFKIIHFETQSGVWDYNNPAKELIDSLKLGKKRFFSEAITAIPTYFISKLELGTGLTIVAQKQ